MKLQDVLDKIFKNLLLGDIPFEEIHFFANAVGENDTDWMMEKIGSLNDPSQFFPSNSQCDKEGYERGMDSIISGFFLFIELVSTLIILIEKKAERLIL